jgi:hypothetical protein
MRCRGVDLATHAGLVVDKQLGNLLLTDASDRVTQGWHGGSQLSSRYLQRLYGRLPLVSARLRSRGRSQCHALD